MKGVGSISILHVVFLAMTVIGLKNHVTIMPPLLEVAKRDSWLSVLFTTIIMFPWLFLLVYIHRKSNQEALKDWLPQKIGNAGAKIVIYTIAIALIIIAAFTMIETLQWINTTFLPKTPKLILLGIYIALCILLVTTSLQTIVIVNVFVLLAVVVFGFFCSVYKLTSKRL